MKILITGANGFIGSNLVKSLLPGHHNILAISRNSYNLNLFDVQFKHTEGGDISLLAKDIIDFNPNVVIHCAWDGGNSFSNAHQTSQFDNVIWGYRLLEILAQLKNVHFVGIGSAAEYGEVGEALVDESFAENPTSLYGISKLSFKVLSEHFCKIHNIQWSWIRPFYTYGPGDVNTRLIPKVIYNCIKQANFELNSCDSIVDYLYIEDFVRGIKSIIYLHLSGTYNICSGQQFKIKDVVQIIKQLTGSNSIITFNEKLNRQQFPTYICGANKKLRSMSKWKPKIDITKGLQTTIDFFYETLNNN